MRKNFSQEVNKKTILVSYFSQLFQYGLAIIVLPIVLNKLEANELGIWYIFLSVASLVKLLDFGFSPSIQRSIAYVAAGARELKVDGYDDFKSPYINERLMSSLIQTCKYIYKRIAFAILILSITLGSFYLYYALGKQFDNEILLIWVFYAFGLSLDFYYSYILYILKGMGFLSEFNINIIVSKLAYILILYFLISNGYGLKSLVVATIINVTIMIVMGFLDLYKKVDGFKEWFKAKEYDNLFSVLWKNARNSGVTSIGVFLLSQAGVLISGFYLSISEVAQLGLVLQLYGILIVVSRVYFNTYVPKISSLWIGNNICIIRKLFVKCQMVGYFLFFVGVFIMFFCGDCILSDIIHSKVLLPSKVVILLYAVFYFMEITHGNCCILISSSNNIPFVNASIITGVASVLLTLFFLLLNIGMISFPLGLIFASLPYNSWKWPFMTYRMLK